MCVIPGSFDMQFDLQVGVGTLVVAKPLDAEVQSVYNITVQVTDGTNFATAQVLTLLICYAVVPPLIHSRPTSNQIIVTSFLGELFTLSFPSYACTPFFLKLSLAEYEMSFLLLSL